MIQRLKTNENPIRLIFSKYYPVVLVMLLGVTSKKENMAHLHVVSRARVSGPGGGGAAVMTKSLQAGRPCSPLLKVTSENTHPELSSPDTVAREGNPQPM